MKAKVLQKFKDKYTGEVREVNTEFTCTKKRLAEILSVGAFVEEIKETEAK